MNGNKFIYSGQELVLFSRATNWKRYWSSQIRPFLGRDVLEVGAGTGSNTPYLDDGLGEWACLEPDATMAANLAEGQRSGVQAGTRVIGGTLASVPRAPMFDSIIYIDVLEHIEDHNGELSEAAARLRPGGTLVVLSPAHQWLFGPFDEAIGHYRRYSAASMRALSNRDLELVSLKFLDSIGILASLFGRLSAKPESPMPTAGQILIWDRLIVPVSRLLDPLLGYRVGKSVVGVWRKRL